MGDLTTSVHASIALAGSLSPIDKETIAFRSGSGVCLFSTVGGRHEALRADGRDVTALCTNPFTRHLLVATRTVDVPAIEVYSMPDKTEVMRLTNGTKLEYTAIGCSRDGSRVVGLGTIPDNCVYVWDTTTGELLSGAVAANPTPADSVTFNPSSRDMFCSSGQHGLQFWTITPLFEAFELVPTKAAYPDTGDASSSSSPSGGDKPASAVKGESTDPRGQWTAHVWDTNSHVYAANAAGEVVKLDAATGQAVSVVEAASGVVVTALLLTESALVAGCEDGVVRWLDRSDLSLIREVTVRPRLRSTDANPVLPIAHLCASTTYTHLFASTSAGSLHRLALDAEALSGGAAAAAAGTSESKDAGQEVDLDRVDHLYEAHTDAVLSVAVLPRLSPSATYVATAAADGRLRVWDYAKRRLVCSRHFVRLPQLAADASGSGSGSGNGGGGASGSVDGSGSPEDGSGTPSGAVTGASTPGGAAAATPTVDGANVIADGDDALQTVPVPEPGHLVDQLSPVTALAAHSRLPLLAVGTADGAVRFCLATPPDQVGGGDGDPSQRMAGMSLELETPSVVVTTLCTDRLHSGIVSHLAFSPDAAFPFVATCSQDDRLVYVVDTRVALGSDGSPPQGQTGFRVVAIATLPAGDRRSVKSMFWRTSEGAAEVCVVLHTAELLSIAVPPPAPADEVATTLPRDVTANIRLRGRMHVSSTSVVCVSWGAGDFGYAASPQDKNLVVVGLGWPAGDWSSGQAVADTTEPTIARASPLASIPAHNMGVLCVAVSPVTPASKDVPVILATGGSDGAVCVLATKGGELVARSTAYAHASAVSSLTFTRDGRFIISTGLDGSMHILSVSGRVVEAATGGKLTAAGATVETHLDTPEGVEADLLSVYTAVASTVGTVGSLGVTDALVHSDDADVVPELAEHNIVAVPGADTALAKDRVSATLAAAAAGKVNAAKDVLRGEVAALAGEVSAMLAANDAAPDLEKLDPSEFVIDTKRAEEIEVDFDGKVDAKRQELRDSNDKRELVIRRVVEQCWESMEVQAVCVRAFKTSAVVHNFPISKQTDKDLRKLNRLLTLRRVEMMELSASRDAKNGAWKGLLEDIPANTNWIVNAGLLPPTLDPTNLLVARDTGADGEEKGEEDDDPGFEYEEDEDDGGDDGDDGDDEFDWRKVTDLLYHPAAVRTPTQRRIQVALLQVLCREVRRKFNEQVQKLANRKQEEMDKIRGKNQRIVEIRAELGDSSPYFQPSLSMDEEPDKFLSVSDADVGFEKYISEEQRRLDAEKAAKREADAAADKDDAPERALMEMMGGTLEARDELSKLEQELVREDWMDELSEEEMTPEQRAALEDFQAKQKAIMDEKAKHRKALELELKKLHAEVKDVCKHFDEQVTTVFHDRLKVKTYLDAQELAMVRLAISVQNREDGLIRDRVLEDKMGDLIEAEELASDEYERFAERTEIQEKKLQDSQRRDKDLERGFKDAMRDAAGGSIPSDSMKLFLNLFRSRATGRTSVASESVVRTMSIAFGGGTASMGGPSMASVGAGGGGGAGGAGAGGGGMRDAMSAAVAETATTSVLDPHRGIDVAIPPSKAEVAAAARADLMQPLNPLDCPEGFEPDEHPELWSRLNALRLQKIEVELQCQADSELLASMETHLRRLKQKLDDTHDQIEAIENEREDLMQQRELAGLDLDVIVRLKQGQDEMESEAVATDYSAGALIPRTWVESTNKKIVELGEERVGILTNMKNFKKSINFMEWEHSYMKAQAHDEEEHYTDLHMLRVTKELQQFIQGGDRGNKQRRDLEKLEAKSEYMKKAHSRTMNKMQRTRDKLSGQVTARADENGRLQTRLRELEESVTMRRSIHETRTGGKGKLDDAAKAKRRMKAVVTRRKLVEVAKAQTEEIDFLRKELDRLRQRTFPSFAHVTEHFGNVDQREV